MILGLHYWQDGTASVGDLFKRSHVATVSSLSRSDGSVSQKLSTTEEGAEDDLSRKDKVSGFGTLRHYFICPLKRITCSLFWFAPGNSIWRSFTCRRELWRRWSWPSSRSTKTETSTRTNTRRFCAKQFRRWARGKRLRFFWMFWDTLTYFFTR